MIELSNGRKVNGQVGSETMSKQRGQQNFLSQREGKSAKVYQKEIIARQAFARGVESNVIRTSWTKLKICKVSYLN